MGSLARVSALLFSFGRPVSHAHPGVPPRPPPPTRGTVAAVLFPDFSQWYLIDWDRVQRWDDSFSPILISGWSVTLFVNFVIFVGTWWTLRRFKHDADERWVAGESAGKICRLTRAVRAQMPNGTVQDDQDAGRDDGERAGVPLQTLRNSTPGLTSQPTPRRSQFLPVLCVTMSLAFAIKDGVAVSSTNRAFSYCQCELSDPLFLVLVGWCVLLIPR
jgi:hypothetical protein